MLHGKQRPSFREAQTLLLGKVLFVRDRRSPGSAFG